MKGTKFNFAFSSGEVVSSSVYKSEGYNYASMSIKRGKDQYANIGYEWQGDSIPDFVTDMLGFMNTNTEEASTENKKEIAEFKKRLSKCLLV